LIPLSIPNAASISKTPMHAGIPNEALGELRPSYFPQSLMNPSMHAPLAAFSTPVFLIRQNVSVTAKYCPLIV
jgi:hypothetical protein